VRDKLYLISVGFAGAAIGLLVAQFFFGASGTGVTETIAWCGFVLFFGGHIWLRMNHEVRGRS
jgi:hypothetical protein